MESLNATCFCCFVVQRQCESTKLRKEFTAFLHFFSLFYARWSKYIIIFSTNVWNNKIFHKTRNGYRNCNLCVVILWSRLNSKVVFESNKLVLSGVAHMCEGITYNLVPVAPVVYFFSILIQKFEHDSNRNTKTNNIYICKLLQAFTGGDINLKNNKKEK